MNDTTMSTTIGGFRQQYETERNEAFNRCQSAGIEPVAQACYPPTDDELRNDYWYAQGRCDALQDLAEELELDSERAAEAVGR